MREGSLAGGPCTVDGCHRVARYAKTGWCETHYDRWRRTGSLELVRMPKAVVGYTGAHRRVADLWGKAAKYLCISCGGQAKHWAYDGTDPSELTEEVQGRPRVYSAWPEFYMPMCVSCHGGMDFAAREAGRTHCISGHELVSENIYIRPSRPLWRHCRICISNYGREKRETAKEAREFLIQIVDESLRRQAYTQDDYDGHGHVALVDGDLSSVEIVDDILASLDLWARGEV